jgi:multiple sugar transport system permease protein
MKKKVSSGKIFIWLFLLIALAVFSLPFIFMISNSFEEFSYSLPYPPRILPSSFNLDAYTHILSQKFIITSAYNSLIITVVTVMIAVFISTLSAYGFARIDFWGRETLFKIYLLTMMIPAFLNIIPQFVILKSIKIPFLFPNGMVGTRSGLILVYIGTMLCGNTFFLKGFFQNQPDELSESVVMDGGGHMTIFRHIMLPLSIPAISTLVIMGLPFVWEEFITAKIILGADEAMMTLPLMLQRLYDQHTTRWEWIFAAAVLMQIPVIAVFLIFQKRFVISGLSEGAIKG